MFYKQCNILLNMVLSQRWLWSVLCSRMWHRVVREKSTDVKCLVSCFGDSWALKREAVHVSEMSMDVYWPVRRYISVISSVPWRKSQQKLLRRAETCSLGIAVSTLLMPGSMAEKLTANCRSGHVTGQWPRVANPFGASSSLSGHVWKLVYYRQKSSKLLIIYICKLYCKLMRV